MGFLIVALIIVAYLAVLLFAFSLCRMAARNNVTPPDATPGQEDEQAA